MRRDRLAEILSNAACAPEFHAIRWDYIPAEVKNAFWPALADAAIEAIRREELVRAGRESLGGEP